MDKNRSIRGIPDKYWNRLKVRAARLELTVGQYICSLLEPDVKHEQHVKHRTDSKRVKHVVPVPRMEHYDGDDDGCYTSSNGALINRNRFR
jgi:hypothetical protein